MSSRTPGQHLLPAIEFEDGSWYREDSKAMAAAIRAAGQKLDGEAEARGSGFSLTPVLDVANVSRTR